MNEIYKIEGAEHFMHENQTFLKDSSYFPMFQIGLQDFKRKILQFVDNNKGTSFVHFGDGDYCFLKKIENGSACPGKRALSKSYNQIDIERFKQGWVKADYHCVEYLEQGRAEQLRELFPYQQTIPTEYLYGLTMNKWFLHTFKGHIGLIGAREKLVLIEELLKRKEYQDYLGIDNFTDYIYIPQKFACDNLDNTIEMVKEQLENSKEQTKVFLYGVGHVKSGLIHHLPKIKNALYIDVGACIDAFAGIIDKYRPYAYEWTNFRLKNYDYSKLDLLAYDISQDKNLKVID